LKERERERGGGGKGAPSCWEIPLLNLAVVLLVVRLVNVEDDAVPGLVLGDPDEGFVHLVEGDDFDLGGDVVLGAEVEHLLNLGGRTDCGAGEGDVPAKGEAGDGHGSLREANVGEVAVGLDQAKEDAHINHSGGGVEDHVEGLGVGVELLLVLDVEEELGAEFESLLLLARGGGEGVNLGAEGGGELDAKVAETADAVNTDLLSRANVGVLEGGVAGDTGAEQGSGGSGGEAWGECAQERK